MFARTKNPFATIDYKQLLQDEKKVPLPDAIYNLECTLAELYTGCIKKVDITRKVLSPATEESPQRPYKEESKILTIVVKPGWKVGTKVVFPKEGDQSETAPAPANVIFVITLKRTDTVDPTGSVQSDTHKWDISGDDLIYTHRLNLIEALTGGTIHITTLDGRVLSIACPEIVSPTYEKRVAGNIYKLCRKTLINIHKLMSMICTINESYNLFHLNNFIYMVGEGMPLYKTPTVKGDLIIRFDIRFPQQLSLTNKDKLKAILK